MGEFDLNTLSVDGEIFESGKKKLRIQKYPDTCGQGLNNCVYLVGFAVKTLEHLLAINKTLHTAGTPEI